MMQLGLFLRIPTENCQFFKYKKENIWDYCDGTVIYFWEFCSENCLILAYETKMFEILFNYEDWRQ